MANEGPARGLSEFGVLLRHFRLKAGLSQESLAERARMSTNGVGALERGYRKTPQRETLALLAGALALSEDQRRSFEAAAVRSSAPRHHSEPSVAVGPWPNAGLSFLPLALTSFVGRDAELEEIATLVRDNRLVTLTGPGGIGKTQTALRVGSALSNAECAACFVGLASVSNEQGVFGAIASAVGMREVPHHPVGETLLAYLQDRALLLILDNCEHVIGAAAEAASALLMACPRIRILATSLEPLRAAGEHAYVLPSLSFPDDDEACRLDATRAAAYGAIELFADRAVAIDHRFALTDENAPIVAEVCRRLDGNSLAIELAAARVKVLPPRQLAQKLDERFRVLTSGERNALPRHQTMRALIDWSHDLLSEPERVLFRRLSVFAGGFTLDTAHAVAGEAEIDEIALLDILSSLVDKSLVQTDPSGDARYRLLESTRQYAREKLVEAEEHDRVERAHAAAFADVAERLDRMYDTTPDREWYAHAEPELENLRSALRFALAERRDVALGQRLAGASPQAWSAFPTEGRRWVAEALSSTDAATPPDIVARLKLAEAVFDSVLVQHTARATSAQRALELFRLADSARGVAFAQRYYGSALVFLGRIAEGEALLHEALAAFRALGNRKMVGAVLEDIGLARQYCGDLDVARERYADALDSFKESGSERNAANVATNLAELEFRAGDAAKAVQLAGEALVLERATGHTLRLAHTLSNISAYLIALERYDDARANARESLALARGGYVEVVVAWTLQHLAAIAALRPEPGEAVDRERAARLLGYVDERYSTLGAVLEYTERRERDAIAEALRESLGGERLAMLIAEGRSWSPERALGEAQAV